VIEEATSLGAAILAAAGAGLFPDVVKAAENICKVDKKWTPNIDHQMIYNEVYKMSNNLYSHLEEKNFFKTFVETLQNKKTN
jgi:ribulose kinase